MKTADLSTHGTVVLNYAESGESIRVQCERGTGRRVVIVKLSMPGDSGAVVHVRVPRHEMRRALSYQCQRCGASDGSDSEDRDSDLPHHLRGRCHHCDHISGDGHLGRCAPGRCDLRAQE